MFGDLHIEMADFKTLGDWLQRRAYDNYCLAFAGEDYNMLEDEESNLVPIFSNGEL